MLFLFGWPLCQRSDMTLMEVSQRALDSLYIRIIWLLYIGVFFVYLIWYLSGSESKALVLFLCVILDFIVTGICEGKPPVSDGSPNKGPVTRKMFPSYDVSCGEWVLAAMVQIVFSRNDLQGSWVSWCEGTRVQCLSGLIPNSLRFDLYHVVSQSTILLRMSVFQVEKQHIKCHGFETPPT